MGAVEIILGIAVILVSLFIIAVVLLQQGHRAGINGAISGGADTFLSTRLWRVGLSGSPLYFSFWRLLQMLLL